MFDILPAELKSVAVRTTVRYAPHPYVWMAPAHAMPTGLGIETEGLELKPDDVPKWDESKVKRLPMLWKNPKTGLLHFQVHPCAVQALEIAPLPKGVLRDGSLFPDGATLTDLKEVRGLLYKMQRPAIAPNVSPSIVPLLLAAFLNAHFASPPICSLYTRTTGMSRHACALPWTISSRWHQEGEGPRHLPQSRRSAHCGWRIHARSSSRIPPGPCSSIAARLWLCSSYRQCNLAASDDPVGPTEEDLLQYA